MNCPQRLPLRRGSASKPRRWIFQWSGPPGLHDLHRSEVACRKRSDCRSPRRLELVKARRRSRRGVYGRRRAIHCHPRRRRRRIERSRGDVCGPFAIRVGCEGADGRQDRRRCQSVPGEKAIAAGSAGPTAASSAAERDGIERLVVDVQLAAASDLIKAQVALNQLMAASPRDAKRRLSYPNIRLASGPLNGCNRCTPATRRPARGAPRRPAPRAAQPPGRRPGGGAKENFDLSTFYANEGALADSDNNLIPDRIDVLLSADGAGADRVVDLAARLGLESTGVALPIAKPRNRSSRPTANRCWS